jgi:hypothetical protein
MSLGKNARRTPGGGETVGFLGRQNSDQRRRPRRRRWLLLGAGLGALAQYLRDPQKGRARRTHLTDEQARNVEEARQASG